MVLPHAPQGPFTAEKIVAWLRTGNLKPNRMVRQPGPTSFSPLRETPPFARVLASGILPAAPPAVPSLGGGGAAGASGGAVETPLWFYVDAQGKEQGPFGASQARGLVRSGSMRDRPNAGGIVLMSLDLITTCHPPSSEAPNVASQ